MHLKGNKQQNLFWECDSAMIQIDGMFSLYW